MAQIQIMYLSLLIALLILSVFLPFLSGLQVGGREAALHAQESGALRKGWPQLYDSHRDRIITRVYLS